MNDRTAGMIQGAAIGAVVGALVAVLVAAVGLERLALELERKVEARAGSALGDEPGAPLVGALGDVQPSSGSSVEEEIRAAIAEDQSAIAPASIAGELARVDPEVLRESGRVAGVPPRATVVAKPRARVAELEHARELEDRDLAPDDLALDAARDPEPSELRRCGVLHGSPLKGRTLDELELEGQFSASNAVEKPEGVLLNESCERNPEDLSGDHEVIERPFCVTAHAHRNRGRSQANLLPECVGRELGALEFAGQPRRHVVRAAPASRLRRHLVDQALDRHVQRLGDAPEIAIRPVRVTCQLPVGGLTPDIEDFGELRRRDLVLLQYENEAARHAVLPNADGRAPTLTHFFGDAHAAHGTVSPSHRTPPLVAMEEVGASPLSAWRLDVGEAPRRTMRSIHGSEVGESPIFTAETNFSSDNVHSVIRNNKAPDAFREAGSSGLSGPLSVTIEVTDLSERHRAALKKLTDLWNGNGVGATYSPQSVLTGIAVVGIERELERALEAAELRAQLAAERASRAEHVRCHYCGADGVEVLGERYARHADTDPNLGTCATSGYRVPRPSLHRDRVLEVVRAVALERSSGGLPRVSIVRDRVGGVPEHVDLALEELADAWLVDLKQANDPRLNVSFASGRQVCFAIPRPPR